MQGWWNENMVIQRVSAVVINHDSAYSLYENLTLLPQYNSLGRSKDWCCTGVR